MTQADPKNREYVKHLIRCRCILPHLKELPDPPLHKFIVFSEINFKGEVVPSLTQCPSCGIVHKVKEVGLSEILKREDLGTILSVKELKSCLPDKLREILDAYELEPHQLQEVKWIVDNEAWGRTVVLSKESMDGLVSGKYIQILGRDFYRFESFSKEDSGVADINDDSD